MEANEPVNPTQAESNVYAAVYYALLAGMVASSLLFAIGLARGMTLHTYFPLDTQWIQQHYHWKAVQQGVAALDPTTLMMLATLVLILTPVARVIVSIYAFAVDRDRKYVAVTSIVLAIMVLTLALAHIGLQ